jgi:ABC-type sugar transport system ATPase subunit
MTAEPMLSASRVVRRFGAVTALDGVSLDVHTG